MTWLPEPPAGLVLPSPPAPAFGPVQTGDPGAVAVGENGDRMIAVPAELPHEVAYDRLPLAPRGTLYLRSEVVLRLLAVHEALPEPYGIHVLDGWRSPGFQAELLAYYRGLHPELGDGFVADPDAGSTLAPHTTGGAVDLTLTYEGRPMALGTDYDAFDPDAAPAALEDGPPSVARDLRRVLGAALRAEGFAPYPLEWWHWSYGEQWWALEAGATRTLYATVERAP